MDGQILLETDSPSVTRNYAMQSIILNNGITNLNCMFKKLITGVHRCYMSILNIFITAHSHIQHQLKLLGVLQWQFHIESIAVVKL